MKKIHAALLLLVIFYLGSYAFLRTHFRIADGSTHVQLPIPSASSVSVHNSAHYLHRLLEILYLPATALDRRLTDHHTTFHSVIMDLDTSRPME